MSEKQNRIFNDVLSVVIIVLAIYISASPLIPDIMFRLRKSSDQTENYAYKSNLVQEIIKDNPNEIREKDLRPIPEMNTLVIPTIGVNGEIYEGETSQTLNKGIWRRPLSSTPDKGGNTVIVAHRYLYVDGPETFYHLDKVKVGDKFPIFWNKVEYDYEVIETKVVPATAVEIEDNTDESIVTLYTCTPLWTAKDRLVIVAKLLVENQ